MQVHKQFLYSFYIRIFPSLRAWLSEIIAIELHRFNIWRPVFLGIGILIYFNANLSVSSIWEVVWIVVPLLFFVYLCIKHISSYLRIGIGILLLTLSGFYLVELRSYLVEAPVIKEEIRHAPIEGVVRSIETYENRARIIISDLFIEKLDFQETPRKVRLSIPFSHMIEDLRIGDRVSLTASLRPPPLPSVPGSHDFARMAWFKGIGGIGYSTGKMDLLNKPESQNYWDKFMLTLSDYRYHVTQKYSAPSLSQNDALPGLRAALVTGQRSQITPETYDMIRDSGLAHLLAISGLHLGLIAVLVFGGIRLFLSFFSSIVLNINTKKIAAYCAIFICFGYMLLSGMTVPSQRAFLMISIAFIGVILDRNVISLRLVSFAAFVILILYPESILSASFQLSFAAVVGLVSVYETSYMKSLYTHFQQSYIKRLIGYSLFLCITTIVATLATAPLSTYHFGQIASYGIIGNLIAVPLMGLIVMPSALLAFVLMPFGLEIIGLYGMDFGLTIILKIASWVTQLDGAVIQIAQYDGIILAIIIFSCLWLCLWKSIIRFYAIPFSILMFLLFYQPLNKEILITSQERLFGVKLARAEAYIVTSGRYRFIKDRWRERWAVKELKPLSDLEREIDYTPLDTDEDVCATDGCRFSLGNQLVFYTTLRATALATCSMPHSIVIYPSGFVNCKNKKTLFIDRGDLIRNGGYLISSVAGNINIRNVMEERSNYPWQLARNK
ncbi:ComEC/Rec2 family competence protein [Curvivirga aplysinae]|uniref:ComEC/Rec2 family competence protein n=1 Tax=Curvivirga aplysinae TaxID=2529852 RepID=UPI0012BD14FB|nr:ComEC/Rec2 family competence protein [Curvivirga aplysinae]MTI09105.1 ComEC family competence protein [Curvivirga aplysinae]